MSERYAGILQSVKRQNLCIAEFLHSPETQVMGKTRHKAEVGRRLRTAIEALGITQVKAAEVMEVSTSKLGNWLRGDNYPDPWSLVLFCDRYGVSADFIYRDLIGASSAVVADELWKRAGASEVASPAAADPASESEKT